MKRIVEIAAELPDQRQHRRHGDEMRDAFLVLQVEQLGQPVDAEPERPVNRRARHHGHDDAVGQPVRVMQRQDVEDTRLAVQPVLADEGVHLREQAAMRNLHAFRPRRRARREQNVGDRLLVDLGQLPVSGIDAVQQRRVRVGVGRRPAPKQATHATLRRLAGNADHADVAARDGRKTFLLDQLPVRKDRARIGSLDQRLEFLERRLGVQEHGGHAMCNETEKQRRDGAIVVAQQNHAIAGRHRPGVEQRADLRHAIEQLAVGQRIWPRDQRLAPRDCRPVAVEVPLAFARFSGIRAVQRMVVHRLPCSTFGEGCRSAESIS